MRITDIIHETTSGGIAGVAMGLGGGDPAASIYGKQKRKKKQKTEMIKRGSIDESMLPFVATGLAGPLILLYIATESSWTWVKKNRHRREVKKTINQVMSNIKSDPEKKKILDDIQQNYVKNGRWRPGKKKEGLQQLQNLFRGQPAYIVDQMISTVKTKGSSNG